MIKVSCPSCQATYRLKDGVRSGAKLACKRCGARFAVPERAEPPPERAPAGVARRRRSAKSPHGLAFVLIVVMAALAIVAILALVGREKPPTFNALKARIDAQRLPAELEAAEFVRRLGSYESQVTEGTYVYFYCRVQEGQAVIVLERGPWENGRALIRQITVR